MTMHARTVLSLQEQPTESGPEGEQDVEGHASCSLMSLSASCQKPF
ncbi:hypothetical protein ACIBSW_19915 [Actinoplanes sp. NPDC049668]